MSHDGKNPPGADDATGTVSYDKRKLSEELRAQVEAIEAKAEAAMEKLREEQEERRDKDLLDERRKQLLKHPSLDLIPKGQSKRRSEKEIDKETIEAVDRRNALSLKGIALERDEEIIALIGPELASPEKARETEQQTPPRKEHDTLGIKSDIDLGGGFGRASDDRRR